MTYCRPFQAYVLEYLVLKRRAHGYAMLTELRGVIGKSSVYDALYRLEGKGFVSSSRDTSVNGPRARRTFEITGLGEKALDRHRTGYVPYVRTASRWAGSRGGLVSALNILLTVGSVVGATIVLWVLAASLPNSLALGYPSLVRCLRPVPDKSLRGP